MKTHEKHVFGRVGCIVDGCGRNHRAAGLCASHYRLTLKGTPREALQAFSQDLRHDEDTGCELVCPSCLQCPLVECAEMYPGASPARRVRRAVRDTVAARMPLPESLRWALTRDLPSYKPRRIPTDEVAGILAMRDKGTSIREISRETGRRRETITRIVTAEEVVLV